MADSASKPNDDNAQEQATEELVAYLDGELDPKAAEGIATRLSLDPTLRAEAESLQRTWDILDILPRPRPSADFATRTLSQAVPMPSASSPGPTISFQTPGAVPIATTHAPRPGVAFWLASIAVILVAAGVGYFGHRELAPPKPAGVDPKMEDFPLMKNLRLYRDVDDMDYLKRLDSPELFGEGGE